MDEMKFLFRRVVRNDIRERYQGTAEVAEAMGLQLGSRKTIAGTGWYVGYRDMEIMSFWRLPDIKDFVLFAGQQHLLGSN